MRLRRSIRTRRGPHRKPVETTLDPTDLCRGRGGAEAPAGGGGGALHALHERGAPGGGRHVVPELAEEPVREALRSSGVRSHCRFVPLIRFTP